MLTDNTITTLADAANAGINFLKDNAKPARTVKFSSQTAGLAIGMMFRNCNVPYYGILGDYKIGSIKASILLENDQSYWEYEIEASTVNYRDAQKLMLFSIQKIAFKIGDDTPAANGLYIDSAIEIQTAFNFEMTNPSTCDQLDATGKTCDIFDAEGITCLQFENVIKEWNDVVNICTQTFRNLLAKLINGEGTSADYNLATFAMDRLAPKVTGLSPEDKMPVSQVRSNNQITSVYYFGTGEDMGAFTELNFSNGGLDNQIPIAQSYPFSLDKSSTNPNGAFALTVTKTDTIL